MLRRAVVRLYSRFRSERVEGEVADAALLVLIVLGKQDRMSLSDLAEAARVTLGSMSQTVRRLEQLAYVTKSHGTQDRRTVLFSLTGQGRAAVTASRRHRPGRPPNRRPDQTASIAGAPGLATGNRIALTSPSFGDGQVIPAKHCGPFIGEEISPALVWDGLPAGTADLALVLEDLDNPGAVPGIHTIAAFAPAGGGLPEGALTPGNPGVRFLPDRRGHARYAGPRPLPGHGAHRYRFPEHRRRQ